MGRGATDEKVWCTKNTGVVAPALVGVLLVAGDQKRGVEVLHSVYMGGAGCTPTIITE